jgi:hypothetical protein
MLCSYFLLNAATFFPHLATLWRSPAPERAVVYVLLFSLSGIGFGVGLMSLNRFLLVPVVLLVVAIVTTNGLARHFLDLRVVNEQTAEWLLSERGEASDVVSAFRGPFLGYLLLSIALIAPALCVARLARRRFRTQMRPLVWASSALLLYCLSGFLVNRYFGAFIPVESNLLVFDARAALRGTPDLPPADMQPVRQTEITKVILIVDESVNYEAYVAELRDKWRRWNGVDYGEAASLANCSAVSNSMLRWGFRAAGLLETEDQGRTPTIWAYARQAGYETWLLDGQRSGSYQNFMTGKEAALIDHYIGVNAGIDTDQAVAERVHELLLQPGKRFVYVNKRGAHFPYTSRYAVDRFPVARNAEQQHAFAVRYSTQGFLDTALEGAPLGDALIIYTSDHGERFDGASPHCNTHPIAQEFSVPLLLISGDGHLTQRAASAAAQLKDRASHQQIFATLLAAMGYDMQSAEAEYGSSLLSATPPEHYFQVRTDKVIAFDHFPYRPSTADSTRRPPLVAVTGR